MTENSKIEWTDHTFNPWVGCTKISPGCDHCYAESWAKRSGRVQWGGARSRTTAQYWQQPFAWAEKAWAAGRRARVFCASLADVFDNTVIPEWRADLFRLIRNTPELDWLLLTKRIGNAATMIEQAMRDCGVGENFRPDVPWQNIWLGATVVNQAEADRDIPKLIATPAAVRFLSCEPLLGPIDLRRLLEDQEHEPSYVGPTLDWVIVGGESGGNARPMHPAWPRDLRDQCAAAGVAFHFKQWGEWRSPRQDERFSTARGNAGKPPAFIVSRHNGTVHCFQDDRWIVDGEAMVRVGKKKTGRELDGRTWDQLPQERTA